MTLGSREETQSRGRTGGAEEIVSKPSVLSDERSVRGDTGFLPHPVLHKRVEGGAPIHHQGCTMRIGVKGAKMVKDCEKTPTSESRMWGPGKDTHLTVVTGRKGGGGGGCFGFIR